jgi:hypothetical protein
MRHERLDCYRSIGADKLLLLMQLDVGCWTLTRHHTRGIGLTQLNITQSTRNIVPHHTISEFKKCEQHCMLIYASMNEHLKS